MYVDVCSVLCLIPPPGEQVSVFILYITICVLYWQGGGKGDHRWSGLEEEFENQ